MSNFIINVTNSGETGTIIADAGFRYTDKLNVVNEGDLKLAGTGTVKRGLLEVGAIVEISRDGTKEFHGIIDSIDNLDGGAISFHMSGFEVWLGKEPRAYANSPWTDTASATIFNAIIAESSYFTAGTVNAGANVDFRAISSESLWNSMGRLSKLTAQDVQVDYPNLEIDILDHRGTDTATTTFNDGVQIRNIRYSRAFPAGNSIKVWGKGDGDNQITATATDGTSISTYGEIIRNVWDATIVSDTDAQARANAERDLTKDPTKVYDFDVINPNQSVIAGDHILLNSKDKDLTNEEVRIVGIERGQRNGVEYMTMQVANAEYGKLMKKRNEIMSGIVKSQERKDTFMQGSGNLSQWASGINAKTGAPLRVGFFVSSTSMQDEAGNLRINSLTVDYDIDVYRKEIGTASFDGSDPQVQNDSGDEDAVVTGVSTGQDRDADADAFWAVVAGGGNDYTEQNLPLLSSTSFSSGDTEFTLFSFFLQIAEFYGSSNSGFDFEIENQDTSSTYAAGTICTHTNFFSISFIVLGDIEGDTIRTTIEDNSGLGADYTYGTSATEVAEHAHGPNSFVADDHDHPNGAYDIDAADLDDISIGDSVSDAGAVNASEVDIYLDFWNGSAWVNKHSVLNTGKILDTDVDISDSGTYPDATGWWRIRIDPDSGTPDYVQGVVNLKHSLDN